MEQAATQLFIVVALTLWMSLPQMLASHCTVQEPPCPSLMAEPQTGTGRKMAKMLGSDVDVAAGIVLFIQQVLVLWSQMAPTQVGPWVEQLSTQLCMVLDGTLLRSEPNQLKPHCTVQVLPVLSA